MISTNEGQPSRDRGPVNEDDVGLGRRFGSQVRAPSEGSHRWSPDPLTTLSLVRNGLVRKG